MTAMRGYIPAATEQGALGVHSLDHFVLAVPDLLPAQRFYADFGLDIEPIGHALALKTSGGDGHSWGIVIEGKRKRLHHLSFGCYPDDLPYLQERAEANGVEIVDAPKGFASNGIWLRDPAGLLLEVKVAPKTSASQKMCGAWSSSPRGRARCSLAAQCAARSAAAPLPCAASTISASARCTWRDWATPAVGGSAGMCLALTIFITCRIPGEALRNTLAISITSLLPSRGRPSTISRKIHSICGVLSRPPISPQILKANLSGLSSSRSSPRRGLRSRCLD